MSEPINFSEVFQLANLGINPQAISFNSLSLESDKFICVRDSVSQQKTIQIVDVQQQNVTTLPNRANADSAIINPDTKVLALRAGNSAQIYNLDMKAKMKAHDMNEQIVFWRWISSNTIAIVTQKSVYHWSMEGSSHPRKMFDRHANLEGATIINYRCDEQQKWLMLIGLTKTPEGTTKGVMQLYSVDKKVTQPIEGHAACFLDYQISHNHKTTVVCIATNTPQGGKLYVMEVPSQNKPADAPAFQKKAAQIQFPSPNDFPVSMQASDKHGLFYMMTKTGFLYLYEVETATLIYKNRISNDTIFASASKEGGFIGVNKSGQVLSVTVNEDNIVSYITNTVGNQQLAVKLASRANLPGADDLYVQQFNNLINQMNVQGAIKLAAESPQGILRTTETIQRLQRLPQMQNQKPAISQYFQYIIEKGKLNHHESLELAKIVLQKPGGIDYIKKLLNEDKIEGSQDLGDLVARYNNDLAMKIYLSGKAHDKIIDSLIQKGDYEKVLQYCKKVDFTPDYFDIFRKLARAYPDKAVQYAIELHKNEETRLDPNAVVDFFYQGNLIKQVTAYLLDILKDDKPEEAELQTRLLEINLQKSPIQVTDSILQQNLFSHYDKNKIATMCEKVGLFQRALENYQDVENRKRVILNTHSINPEWLVNFFGDLSQEESLIYLRELMRNKQNLQIVVKVATQYSEELEPQNLIPIFEQFNSQEGLYYYLGSIINYTQEEQVHTKYIQAATRVNQITEVERVTRESDSYDPETVKEFLKEVRLQNQMPLINVCDKHGYIDELVRYLHNHNQRSFIDMFIKQRNPLRTPEVVGALLDVDANEDYIKNLVVGVGASCPTEQLVEEVEKRNRLKLITPWLEARANEGSTEPPVYNALAKIYIDTNNNAEQFLKENQYYDSRVVGQYCEKRDPHLAFIAYKKGQCDLELVSVTNKNGMFKHQARYLVERQNIDLWQQVLDDENQYRRQVIDQVVQTALPECDNSEAISTTIKAFMKADLPNELIELLDKIVVHGTKFRDNHNLQKLLIFTAIKADPGRVMDYINRLDNYDGPEIARVCINSELYEEAYTVYNKFKLYSDAIRVLIDYIHDLERALEYAQSVDEQECWSILGRAQLENSQASHAIESFLKAEDPTAYHDVINEAERQEEYSQLIKYLDMARKKVQDSHIDTELVYSYAQYAFQSGQNDVLADLEDFISGPNLAQIQGVGDRCFDEGLYEAARILFHSISNYSRLASSLVKLGRNREAVSAAQKANSIKTWKEVMAACVDAGEFRYAQSCGLNIIIHADELEDLIHYYESRGHFEQLIELMEKGLGLERAHMGIFTELGVLYARYRPEKVMEHITRYWARSNIPKLLSACEENHLWAEMRFLYCNNEEPDNAIKIMMEHSPEAFEHNIFLETITKVVNMELYYRAIQFYLQEKPKYVHDLLTTLSSKLDHERVARDVRSKEGGKDLPLIKRYLQNVQEEDLEQVNEALNQIYIEEEDYESLRESVDQHRNFDQLALARQLEKHELLEFRRISSWLYKENEQYSNSIELSKKDHLYQDAMQTASQSKNQEVAEDLLKFFVSNGQKDCFTACLYNCYSFIRPDVALELAWKNNITDMVMPFMVQVLREYTSKVDHLEEEHKKQKQQQEEAENQEVEYAESMVSSNPYSEPYPNYPQSMYGMAPPPPPGSIPPGGFY